MPQEDLTLSLRRVWVRVGVGLAQLEVRLGEHKRPALQSTEEVVRARVEGQDMVPRGGWFRTYRGVSSPTG